jgi:hypothetical protein
MDEYKCTSGVDVFYFDIPQYLKEEGYDAAIYAEAESLDGAKSDSQCLFLKLDQILKLHKSLEEFLLQTVISNAAKTLGSVKEAHLWLDKPLIESKTPIELIYAGRATEVFEYLQLMAGDRP